MSDPATTTKPKGRMGGKRPGAGGAEPCTEVDVIPPDSSSNENVTVDSALAELADSIIFDDMTTREKVWHLHFLHGWPLRKIGKALGVTHQAIHKHTQAIEAELDAAPADPQATRRRTVVRERLEAQYARAMEIPDTEKSIVFALKTLEVMAKLDGLNLETQAQSSGAPPYSAPDEIASEVRQKILELHQRPTSLLSPPQQLP